MSVKIKNEVKIKTKEVKEAKEAAKVKEMYVTYKNAQKLLSKLERNLKILDDDKNKEVMAFFKLFEDYTNDIINSILKVDDFVEFCQNYKSNGEFAVDKLYTLIYYNDSMSFQKFYKVCLEVKKDVLDQIENVLDN